jgi:RES domain-containing protein
VRTPKACAVWRIATETPDFGSDDLSGKGAEKTGGRWNRKGTPVIYASYSIALAYLETLVHLSGPESLPLNRYLIKIDVPAAAWKARTVFDAKMHVGWDALPAGLVSLDWGTAWVRSCQSLLAEIPSIVVPDEFNVLINPGHPDAAKLIAKKIRRWNYDTRLI